MSALTPHFLRDRDTPQGSKVTFVELLFDLVFVFTIIQLSHHLAAHYTPMGAIETLILMLAVWWVWIYTTWFANWLDPDQWPVRLVMFALMFAGLVVAVSIPGAFGERGLAFALAFVSMQLGRVVFVVWALHGNFRQRNFIRIGCWLALAGAFWIAGAFVAPEARIAVWGAAVAIEYASPAFSMYVPGLGRSTHAEWDVSGAHMAERCALFVIICLGETVLVTGRTLADAPLDADAILTLVPTFMVTIAMWWVYFRFGYERAEARIEASDTPGGLARSGYTYAHIPIVGGIILAAVGAELMIAHPHERAAHATAAAIVGGPALFVAGNLWLKALVEGRAPLSHVVGLAAMTLIALLVPLADLRTLDYATAAALLLTATWEWRSLGATAAGSGTRST